MKYKKVLGMLALCVTTLSIVLPNIAA
ncbi:hypothetical protein ENT_02000 [Enterococcus faecalis]|nr:hypothetical protein ENT_02000 [Enterococcus faecalis]